MQIKASSVILFVFFSALVIAEFDRTVPLRSASKREQLTVVREELFDTNTTTSSAPAPNPLIESPALHYSTPTTLSQPNSATPNFSVDVGVIALTWQGVGAFDATFGVPGDIGAFVQLTGYIFQAGTIDLAASQNNTLVQFDGATDYTDNIVGAWTSQWSCIQNLSNADPTYIWSIGHDFFDFSGVNANFQYQGFISAFGYHAFALPGRQMPVPINGGYGSFNGVKGYYQNTIVSPFPVTFHADFFLQGGAF